MQDANGKEFNSSDELEVVKDVIIDGEVVFKKGKRLKKFYTQGRSVSVDCGGDVFVNMPPTFVRKV